MHVFWWAGDHETLFAMLQNAGSVSEVQFHTKNSVAFVAGKICPSSCVDTGEFQWDVMRRAANDLNAQWSNSAISFPRLARVLTGFKNPPGRVLGAANGVSRPVYDNSLSLDNIATIGDHVH